MYILCGTGTFGPLNSANFNHIQSSNQQLIIIMFVSLKIPKAVGQ